MKKMKKITFLLLFVIISLGVFSQVDTTENLLGDLEVQTKDTVVNLLPHKMLLTQRMMWGEKGLMRNFDAHELNPLNREKELRLRRAFLVTHQITGLTTLGLMTAQAVVGFSLYNGNTGIKDVHEILAGATNIFYFTTAGFVFFAPPKMIDERAGFSSIKVHKALAIIHFTSMLATDILAAGLENNPQLKPYHRAAALTAFGSLAAAMLIIKF